MITSIGEMNKELRSRLAMAGMEYDCLADGDVNSKVVIVCEAPGNRERELKIPLIGGSGKFLWDILAKQGLRRQHCYITNVCKRQLILEDNATKKGISTNELSHWKGILEWELSQLPNAKYIVVLGGVALEALTGLKGIEAWRGTVIPHEGKYFIISYNPAMLMRKPNLTPIYQLDMAKLDMCIRGAWTEHVIRPLINPSPREAVEWCSKMIDERRPVSFDIETKGKGREGETACIGFANDAHTGMCINFRDHKDHRFTLAEEASVRRAIQRVLRHPEVNLIAQNGAFDCAWLWYKDRIRVKPMYMDTLLAHHTLYPTWPHNLGFLTAQYTTHPYYKDEKDEHREGGDINSYWEYNVKDVCITHRVAEKLAHELKHRKLDNIYFNHVMKLQPHLVAATVLGNRVDLDMKKRLEDEYSKTVHGLLEQFVAEARIAVGEEEYEVNPNSPKQLTELMFKRLRLVGKGISTNKSNRDAIIANPRTPDTAKQMLITLNQYQSAHKLYSTYITSKVDEDNRMRSDYKQFGTQYVPGRLSSSATLWDSGMNLQNQPEQLRGMFIADPGYVFVYFDGAQAEARIVAYEANIAKWKEQFERARLNPGSYDAHIALASEMFHVPYDSVPKFDYYDETNASAEHPIGSLSLRAISKRCRHGLNYRMQAARLAETTKMSLADATTAYNAYHRATPELVRWWDEVLTEAKTARVLWTCKGRALPFFGSTLDESLLDSIIAFKPQSTLGDHVTEVQWKSQEDYKWPRSARIPFNNHDSLTAMCKYDDVELVANIMKKYMEQPLIIKGDALIIPSDFKVSYPDEKGTHRWSAMKKLVLS